MRPAVAVLALGLLIPAAPVLSQSLTIRSGEHSTFTRLTLKLPANAQWSITRGDRSAKLEIDNPDIVFDTSLAFDRIPKTRVNGLSQPDPGGPLTLQFGCDCDVDWFVLTGSLLVIDVRDESPAEQASRSPLIPTNGQAYRFNGLAPLERFWSTNNTQPDLRREKEARNEPNLPMDPEEPTVRVARQMEVGLNISEKRLLEQIGRAADQGLLTPVDSLARQHARTKKEQPKSRGTNEGFGQDLPINISAKTSVDRGLVDVAQSLLPGAAEHACLPSDLVLNNDWADDRGFSSQISELRSQLYGEFDDLDEQKAIELAKAFLYFGFGAEAMGATRLASASTPQAEALYGMGAVLDDTPPPARDPFADQQHCESDVALWSVLSQNLMTREANKNAIQQAFSRLPIHLRTHLGPRLSETIANSGDLELAAAILRAIDRSDGAPTPGEKFADGLIAKTSGDLERSNEVMEKVVVNDSDYSPRALIELVESHWTERKALDPDLSELAGAYSSELGNSDLGADLRRTHSVSLALVGRFDEAMAIVSDISRLDGHSGEVTATNHVFALMTENADDVSFLKHLLSRFSQIKSESPDDLNDRITKRLLELGFASEAMDLASQQGSAQVSVDRRLIRAEAAIASNLPHRALVELLGVSGSQAAQLRAQAMWHNRDYQMAAQVLLESESIEEATRGFWHGDSWEEIPEGIGSVYAEVAELSEQIRREPIDTDTMPPLAGARALLADSETVRGKIQTLFGYARTASGAD